MIFRGREGKRSSYTARQNAGKKQMKLFINNPIIILIILIIANQIHT